MLSGIEKFLAEKLASGGFVIAQVSVAADLSLHHVDDSDLSDLELHTDPHDAAEIARWDAEGNYRPLKGAPTLRRGWLLKLKSTDEVRLVLDLIYPAAIGLWLAWLNKSIAPTPLNETLARQTGMFRRMRDLPDAVACSVVQSCCNPQSGCLRHNVWPINATTPHQFTKPDPSPSPREIPFLCTEACNLWIAAAHAEQKASEPRA